VFFDPHFLAPGDAQTYSPPQRQGFLEEHLGKSKRSMVAASAGGRSHFVLFFYQIVYRRAESGLNSASLLGHDVCLP
jgi:hypothetical protein